MMVLGTILVYVLVKRALILGTGGCGVVLHLCSDWDLTSTEEVAGTHALLRNLYMFSCISQNDHFK